MSETLTFSPTLRLNATSGTVTVTSKLYGPVGAARQAAEQESVAHRAAQLNLARIERIPRRDDEMFNE